MLSLRREQPALFREGDYRGLQAEGAKAAHVVAFARRHGDQMLVLIAARLFSSLAASGEAPVGELWGDTVVRLPEVAEGMRFENVLTGEMLALHEGVIRVSAAFAHFPGAALRAKP
jgi:(1->4)-alpha-D-glucan 1-alpha-D-glucosylmutase